MVVPLSSIGLRANAGYGYRAMAGIYSRLVVLVAAAIETACTIRGVAAVVHIGIYAAASGVATATTAFPTGSPTAAKATVPGFSIGLSSCPSIQKG